MRYTDIPVQLVRTGGETVVGYLLILSALHGDFRESCLVPADFATYDIFLHHLRFSERAGHSRAVQRAAVII